MIANEYGHQDRDEQTHDRSENETAARKHFEATSVIRFTSGAVFLFLHLLDLYCYYPLSASYRLRLACSLAFSINFLLRLASSNFSGFRSMSADDDVGGLANQFLEMIGMPQACTNTHGHRP